IGEFVTGKHDCQKHCKDTNGSYLCSCDEGQSRLGMKNTARKVSLGLWEPCRKLDGKWKWEGVDHHLDTSLLSGRMVDPQTLAHAHFFLEEICLMTCAMFLGMQFVNMNPTDC
ncbi:hypothetical protein CAPTEDRAFT_200646, partial [Capitella teleta]